MASNWEQNQIEWQRRENWKLGLYFCPRDTRLMVPKRRDPSSTTPNLGHPTALRGALGLVALPVGLLGLAFLMQLLR